MVKILDNILTFAGLIIAIAVILFLSYVFSKYIGRGVMGYSSSSNIKVVDRIILGQDKSLAIVKVGNKYYLIGISSAGINMLNEVSPDDLQNIEQINKFDENKIPQFKNIFAEVKKRL